MPDNFDVRSSAVKLLKTCNFAALASLGEDMMPFASLVSISVRNGEPILLLVEDDEKAADPYRRRLWPDRDDSRRSAVCSRAGLTLASGNQCDN